MAALAFFVAALAVSAQAYDVRRFSSKTSGSEGPEVLPPAQYAVPLAQKVPRHPYKTNIRNAVLKHKKAANYTGILAGSDDDEEYLTDITIGEQNFTVIVDTGSSDTWLANKGFNCFNLTSYPEPQSECAFGTTGFDQSKSTTFTDDPNKNFNISYGDGEFLTGTVAFETVTVGGMTVKNQEIGLVTDAAWLGDGINSGLLGLAYSGLTSVYNGTDPDDDSSSNSDPYTPYFFSAISENVVSNPYFSVALNRGSFAQQENSSYDPNLGYLAFGGIAPVPTDNTSITVPVQGYSVSSGSKKEYLFYTVDIDTYIYDGSKPLTGTGKQAILDTGTTLNYVPSSVAKAYNSKFVPAADFHEDEDTYYVECNATVPAFAVEIGGQNFTIDAKDQILPVGTDDNGKELCISGTQDGGDPSDSSNIFIMGDVFLHNVVSTFNVKSNKITLTKRAAY